MIEHVIASLKNLEESIVKGGDKLYQEPCQFLSNASIGQHTRHIIEMFQCLYDGYEIGRFSYDKRARNQQIETDLTYAVACIQQIAADMNKEDKNLISVYWIKDEEYEIRTNYFRELMFNFDHCIHHQALIRVAFETSTDIQLSADFGLSPSTIEFKKQCVQ